jgi:hypothetical protein
LNLAKALEAQRRLIEQRPEDAGAYNDLGNLLQMAGSAAEAEAAYQRALELDPKRTSARFNLGLLLQQRGERRPALRHYRQVVEQQPQHAWAHFQIGTLREAAGDESGAVDAYAEAFRLDPQLAFPEVNPQVLSSELVTQAMLRAYRGPDAGSLPPPIYEQPSRIADLLVPPVPVPATEEGGATDVAGAAPEAGTAARPRVGAGAPPAGQPGTRVLRPGNLQGGGVNQASPQAGARGGSRARGGFVPPPSPDWSRPDPEGRHDEDSFEPPMEVPSTTVVIRPGPQSTGRLELEAAPPRATRTG